MSNGRTEKMMPLLPRPICVMLWYQRLCAYYCSSELPLYYLYINIVSFHFGTNLPAKYTGVRIMGGGGYEDR